MGTKYMNVKGKKEVMHFALHETFMFVLALFGRYWCTTCAAVNVSTPTVKFTLPGSRAFLKSHIRGNAN